MTPERPEFEKVRKLQALIADRAATAGEKAAAADRIRALWQRLRQQGAGEHGLMYRLGRAWGRSRRGEVAEGGADAMYVLGKALRRLTSKR